MLRTSLGIIIFLMITGCSKQQISKSLGGILDSNSLTTEEVSAGLKEALIKGISQGSASASKTNGYYKNPRIKIPLPPDIQEIEGKLRDIGLGSEVDKFLLTLNRGAEKAATEAKPIFINAIRSMTIRDAWGILKGDEHAATNYLKKTTSNQLRNAFQPEISKALEAVNATKYYSTIVTSYNKLPFVTRIDPDLESYATDQAIEGLFYLIAQEEEKIRKNPAARTTELLREVFGYSDS